MSQPFAQAPTLDAATFERIRRIVHARSGIALSQDKVSLVTARLGGRMRSLGLESFRKYLEHLEGDESGNELTLFLDAISTNVTYFFREPDHFDFLQRSFRGWISAGQRRFRMWSAACSSGEEPYSLAMALADQVSPDVDLRILATDISTRMLTRAMRGVYPERALDSIPAAYRQPHVTRDRDAGEFEVRGHLKQLIAFRHMNLIELPFPIQGPLDVVLCRNVMIYFDPPTREKLVSEFHRVLRPGGHLIVSHSESLVGLRNDFQALQPSIYVKRGGPSAPAKRGSP